MSLYRLGSMYLIGRKLFLYFFFLVKFWDFAECVLVDNMCWVMLSDFILGRYQINVLLI